MQENRYHHEDLKEELISAGIRLLDADGYENFSLRNVAKACGVSHTAPYRHFKNKDELISAIAAEINCQFNDCLKTAVAAHPDSTKDQINGMGCAYVSFFLENPVYLRLMFLSDLDKKVDLPPQGNGSQPRNVFFETVRRYAAEKKQKNPAEQTDSDVLALKLWGLVHGITVLLVHGDFQYNGDVMELVRKIIQEKK
jgi:AcrR family transcriptional regulator